MCQMQPLQNMLCPAAILVCILCALVPAYLMMLLESVQLLIRALCFYCFIPCCVLFLGQLSLILLHTILYTPGCRGSFFARLLKFVPAVCVTLV